MVAAALVLGVSSSLRAAGSERALIRDAGFRDGDVGYLVYDLERGQILRRHQPDKAFIPASMVKIVTGLVALEVLGAEYRFETRVFAAESAGGLHLHLSGGGDPVLVEEDLDELAEALVIAVAGRPVVRFTYDDAALPSLPLVDPSDDSLKPYNPPVSALSVNFNRQWLRWSRDEVHRVMRVSVRPDFGLALAGIASRAATDGRSIRIVDGPKPLYLLEPKVPAKGHRQVTVRDPAIRAATMLQFFAARSGLELPPPQLISGSPPNAQTIATHQSEPLIGIVEALLKYSNNLSAELIGLAAAKVIWRDVRNLAESAAAVRTWLAETIPAAADNRWRASNQSGLASDARVTPAALLAILQYAAQRRYGPESQPFLALLPEPSKTSPMKNLSLRAKSGTMFYARGQAGVLQSRSGRILLFVLMHTDFAARRRYEQHPERFTAPVQAAAGVWLSRARLVEQAILKHWAASL